MSARYDIVIPTGPRRDLLRRCVDSIEAHSEDYRIILIDDAIGAPPLPSTHRERRIDHIRLPRRYGSSWTSSTNIGLAVSSAPFVVLMNDDTVVQTRGWLDLMADGFSLSRIAAVGPRSNTPSYQGRIEEQGLFLCPETKVTGEKWGIGGFCLSFFCVMISREAFLDVGFMDPRFNEGYGMQEDDWMARAQKNGWRFAIETRVMVEHESSGSYGVGGRARLTAQNYKLLRQKWGFDA